MTRPTAIPGGHEHRGGRRVWLLRHGETTGGSSQRYFGATDIPLSDVGRAQVARLANLLIDQDFAALVHSPLSRASESARIVLGTLRRPPLVIDIDERLRELNFGDMEGLNAAEIEDRFPGFFAEWRAGRTLGYPGGETTDSFRTRVAAGIDAALAHHAEGDLCIVAHRGVVKAALVHLLGLSWSLVRPWSLDLGSASVVVESDDGRWTLDRYNVVG